LSQRYGVEARSVANLVAYAIRGTPLPRFSDATRQVDVRIRYREEDRQNVDQILGYRVPTRAGGEVPLKVLAQRKITQAQAQLTRSNKRVGKILRLELDPERRAEAAARVQAFLDRYPLPEGQSFDAAIQSQEIADMQRDLTG